MKLLVSPVILQPILQGLSKYNLTNATSEPRDVPFFKDFIIFLWFCEQFGVFHLYLLRVLYSKIPKLYIKRLEPEKRNISRLRWKVDEVILGQSLQDRLQNDRSD